jgi:CDP-diglyceride synthetase
VDQGPDKGDDDVTDEVTSHPEASAPPTGGVRIIGAETAAEITSELPVVPPAHITPDHSAHSSVRILDEQTPGPVDGVTEATAHDEAAHDPTAHEPGHAAGTAPGPAATELPHWTEPPTGQVPAVLSRDDSGPGTIHPPTWREGESDWTAHEEAFEPSMFGDEQPSLGALDESGEDAEVSRPWEFDLESVRPGQPGPGASTHDPITEPVMIGQPSDGGHEPSERTAPPPPTADAGESTTVYSLAEIAGASPADAREGAGEPTDEGQVPGAAGVVAAGALDDVPTGDVPADDGRPSGTPRVGRARRSGLLPARLTAKRPQGDVVPVAEPLAAEPPGASVADVPGAGRRKAGLASLAAADRAAEEVTPEPVLTEETADDEEIGPRFRRKARVPRSSERPLRSSANYTPEVTGGGPPEPQHARSRHADEVVGGSTGLRVGTGVAVAVVALLAFKVGTVTSVILCLLVVTCAAGEAFAVLRRAGWRPATLLGLVGTVSLMLGAYNKGVAALPLVLVLITAFTLLWYLFGVERGSAVAGTASTLLVVGWVGLLGSFAGLLLCPALFPDRHGIAFLLGAIIATVANDVGALVVGRWIGSRQLAPNVSPNKTWEGLAGGALASILVSTVVVGAIHPWSPANAALLGVVVAVVAPLGDLCESLLKRDLKLKDMGTVLPGHGGVLDRVDALIFVLPATFYLVRALNIG